MHTVPHSPQPANFHVAAAGSDVAGLFADSQHMAHGQGPNASSTTSRRLWKPSLRRKYLGDANVWWDNWVPVAATGWGALFVIGPLLAADCLIRATGVRLRKNRTPDRSDVEDSA